MADTPETPPPAEQPYGFPFATAIATLVALFLFLGLVLVAYYSPNYLGGARVEPRADPVAKLKEVQARNQAVLDGSDPSVKMSVEKAAAEAVAQAEKAKGEQAKYGRLPFPVEPKAAERK